MMAAVCSACVPEPTSRLTCGSRDAELLEEVGRHARVVVLAGVHQTPTQAAALRTARVDRADDRRDLHEVRPRAGDDVDEARCPPVGGIIVAPSSDEVLTYQPTASRSPARHVVARLRSPAARGPCRCRPANGARRRRGSRRRPGRCTVQAGLALAQRRGEQLVQLQQRGALPDRDVVDLVRAPRDHRPAPRAGWPAPRWPRSRSRARSRRRR